MMWKQLNDFCASKDKELTKQAVYEYLKHGLGTSIPVSSMASTLQPIAVFEDYQDFFADICWLLDVELNSVNVLPNFKDLILLLIDKSFIGRDFIGDRVSPKFAESLFLVINENAFNKKLVRTRTSLLYKQRKFNLFCEEAEGYAKLLCVIEEASFEELLHLIGLFNLDPNRVFDMLFDVFSVTDDLKKFVKLVDDFGYPSKFVSTVIGFRSKTSTKFEFFKLVAALIVNELVQFEDVIAYLDSKTTSYLIEAMLLLGEKKISLQYLNTFPEIVRSNQRIARNICVFLHEAIEPLYSLVRPAYEMNTIVEGNMEVDVDFKSFFDFVSPWMKIVHKYLNSDVVFLTKCIRITLAALKSSKSSEWVDFFVGSLIPSFSRSDSNFAMAEEFYQIFKLFPYKQRYSIYSTWNDFYSTELTDVKNKTMHETKKILRRLAKDNVDQISKIIGKLSHSNPLVVFSALMDNVQAYDNMISPIADSFVNASALSLNVLSFYLIQSLNAQDKSRLKEDGTNISKWLQGLATFAGILCKKYSSVDLEPILTFIANQLKQGNSFHLVVLKELIQKMTGVESQVNCPDSFVQSMAGGKLLKSQLGKSLKKSASRLFAVLVDSKLLIELWILIARHKDHHLLDENVSHLKLLGNLIDDCQDIFLQYSDFVSLHESRQEFQDLMPNPIDLCMNFGVSIESAFYMSSLDLKDSSILDPTRELLKTKGVTLLTSEAFLRFWSLHLSDIYVPIERYNSEIQKIKSNIEELNSKEAEAASEALELELTEKQKLLADLKSELSNSNIFQVQNEVFVQEFTQHCVLPRGLFSVTDSLFTAKFIILLNDVGLDTATLILYLGNILLCLLSSCTANEAANFGYFLQNLFPSFDGLSRQIEVLLFDAAVKAFRTSNYMLVKNTILILTKLSTEFPCESANTKKLGKIVVEFAAKEIRDDLKLLAQRYSVMLKSKLSPKDAPSSKEVNETKINNESTAEVKKRLTDLEKNISAKSPQSLRPTQSFRSDFHQEPKRKSFGEDSKSKRLRTDERDDVRRRSPERIRPTRRQPEMARNDRGFERDRRRVSKQRSSPNSRRGSPDRSYNQDRRRLRNSSQGSHSSHEIRISHRDESRDRRIRRDRSRK